VNEADVPVLEPPINVEKERYLKTAVNDLMAGIQMYQLWGRLGWNDLIQRYQRSLLGPIWLTLSMGILIGALSYLYSSLFKMDIESYLPFLAVGFILWQLISGILLDSCNVFTSTEGIIKQIKLPFSVHIYRLLWRNFITFLHNAVVIVVVITYFDRPIDWTILFIIPGLIIIFLNGISFGFLLGMLCTRFRDLNPTIVSLIQLAFFVTPILWEPSLIPDRQFLLFYNPFYHFVESVRAPILGTGIATETWLILIVITLVGWILVLPVINKVRRNLVYWL
jgi:ABC-type polysaccharide/polyol phosphate export permease